MYNLDCLACLEEVAYDAGGTGTYPFLIGAGRFIDQEFVLKQFFMPDPLAEAAQLAAFEAFIAPARVLSTFNGKAFDAPLINTRFSLQGVRSPLQGLAHVDLLHLARRLWRDRLPSRTLGNLEVQILEASRTEEDIPGWQIPEIYFTYLQTGDPAPLRRVFYHNANDVLSLAALLNHMAGWLNDPLTSAGRYGSDLIALAKLFESLGDLEQAALLYTQALSHPDALQNQIPPGLLLQAVLRLALIHKRQNRLPAAIELWEQAARRRHLEAHIELAKCFEHQLRDLRQALQWTEAALALLESGPILHSPGWIDREPIERDPLTNDPLTSYPLTSDPLTSGTLSSGNLTFGTPLSQYQKNEWIFALQHRHARLKKKLGEE